MINISNSATIDNPARPRLPAAVLVRDGAGGRSAGSRLRDGLALAAGVTLDWVAFFIRRWGDRWFAMNDAEAYWRGWQITKAFGGLGRRYRDIRFGALAACERCAGAGIWADAACSPCLGTGRITLGEAG